MRLTLHKQLTLTVSMLGVVASVAALATQMANDDIFVKTLIATTASFFGAFMAYSIIRIRLALSAPTVFISYARPDTEFATRLASALKTVPVNVWIDREEVKVGENLKERIDELIESADYVVCVISEASAQSDWAKNELSKALESKKKLLPVLLSGSSLPEAVKDIVYADFTHDFDTGVDALRKSLKGTAS